MYSVKQVFIISISSDRFTFHFVIKTSLIEMKCLLVLNHNF